MFNYYIMKNLANSTHSRDTSIFRFELDCTSYDIDDCRFLMFS